MGPREVYLVNALAQVESEVGKLDEARALYEEVVTLAAGRPEYEIVRAQAMELLEILNAPDQ